MLADDTVFATCDPHGSWRVVDGGFRFEDGGVFGWEESVRCRSADGPATPLLGCVRIHKAQHVKVARLDPVETARHLMDAVMEVDVQRKFGRLHDKTGKEKFAVARVRRMRLHWFHLAADIARACPGWHLWFPRDSHFSDLICAIAKVSSKARRQTG
jgi:hypothetical protein